MYIYIVDLYIPYIYIINNIYRINEHIHIYIYHIYFYIYVHIYIYTHVYIYIIYISIYIYIYLYTKKQHKTSKQTSQPLGWELLDTKSGKARPCSPPESDEDSVIRGEVAGCP